MGVPALEMRGICKAFPGTVALRNVDFKVAPGEIRALIGANGAGKSTLMNVLVGVHQRDAGEISVRGEKVEHNSPPEALRRGIAIVPQELSLVPELSVAENVFLGNFVKGRNRLIDWRSTQHRAEELLAAIGVHLDVNQKLGKLSAAYQQLVSIARALAFGSYILILDEPTAALSAHEAELLFAAMRRLRAGGTAIVFITHHLDEVKEVADGLTIMRDGQVVFDGEAKDLPIPEIIFHMANRRVEFERLGSSVARGETFLEVRGLCREGEFEDVSFQVRKGEILGIAGLVGAGRTELCNAIFGVTRKDAGSTLIEGKEVEIDGPRTAIAHDLGYVPEERRRMALFAVLSVLENMLLPSFHRVSSKGLIDFGRCQAEADGFVKELSIKTPSVEVPIRSLSGGNQQKVVLARWIAKQTRLLILDEPTRGIDVNAKSEIHKLVRKLAEQGLAVIVVSSESEEILALADRIMVMHEGRVRGFLEDPRRSSQEDILAVAMASATEAAAKYQPRKEAYRLTFLPMLTHPWYDAIRAGVEAAVQSYAKRGVAVRFDFHAPPAADGDAQVALLEAAAAERADAIAVDISDVAKVVPTINRIIMGGVPVMTFGGGDAGKAQGCDRLAFVGNTENLGDGARLAEELARAIDFEGEVATLEGTPGAPSHEQRIQGFDRVMAAYPRIKVVARHRDHDDLDTARKLAEAFLQKFPSLRGIWCNDMTSPAGVLDALAAVGRLGKVVVVGMDHDLRTLQGVKEGTVRAAQVQNGYDMGFYAVVTALQLADGARVGSGIEREVRNVGSTTVYQDKAQSLIDVLYKKQ
jgi:ribose transport system ATP-binding protein